MGVLILATELIIILLVLFYCYSLYSIRRHRSGQKYFLSKSVHKMILKIPDKQAPTIGPGRVLRPTAWFLLELHLPRSCDIGWWARSVPGTENANLHLRNRDCCCQQRRRHISSPTSEQPAASPKYYEQVCTPQHSKIGGEGAAVMNSGFSCFSSLITSISIYCRWGGIAPLLYPLLINRCRKNLTNPYSHY